MKTFTQFAGIAGVSRQAIYKAVSKGLLPAVGNKIDETCADAVAYLEISTRQRSSDYVTPPVVEPAPRANRKPMPKVKVKPAVVDEIKPLSEKVKPSGEPRQPKQPAPDQETMGFKSKAELEIKRLEQQIESLKLRNQETVGNLIPREKVERLIFQPISVAHQRMLSDGAKAIAAYLHPYIAGGATVLECEAYIRKQLSGFIKAAKRDMKKVISDDPD